MFLADWLDFSGKQGFVGQVT